MAKNEKFKDKDDAALAALATEKKTAFAAHVEGLGDTPSDEQIETGEALSAEIDEIDAEISERTAEASARQERLAALRGKTFATETEPEAEPTEDEPTEPEAEPETEPEAEPEDEPEAVTASAKAPSARAAVAARASRPKPPATQKTSGLRISAAANVEGFNAGADLDGLTDISRALIAKTRGFTPPTGDGTSENLQKFGVATIALNFDEDMRVNERDSEMQMQDVLDRAGTESRLEGNSLVAAGGWCSPSETLYDLAADESLDGLVSVPEIQVNRGGIRFTRGPQFADFYAEAGFIQTEAQAIAGTTKPCYEVDCPEFTDVRLDAVGVCIKVPILTNAAWPELVNRFTSGTLIAHQHMVNANVIGRMVTIAGAARVFAGLGAAVTDALEALDLVADQRRQKYRLSFNRAMEVVLPFWVKAVHKNDIARRSSISTEAVTDQMLKAHFAARNLNVQYVYDWQVLDETAEVYPGTVNALIYPSGTFVKGVSPVINLGAVYDAASLAVNTYTGMFMEQGLLVASRQYGADLVTLPLCAAGRAGAGDLTCTVAP